MLAYVEEKEKVEVEKLIDKFTKSGIIKSAGDIKKYVHHINRKTRKPTYWYRCECELTERRKDGSNKKVFEIRTRAKSFRSICK